MGAVVVGGKSTRFGRAKWSEPVGGVPMVERATTALAPHAREVVALAGSELVGIALPVVRDLPGGGGPLAALAAVLQYALDQGDGGALVLACDLPLIDHRFLGALIDAWEGEDLVVPGQAGWIQPFCAVWSTSALPPVLAALSSEDRSPLSLAKRLRTRVLGESEWRGHAAVADPLLNVNTPADLARAELLLSGAAGRSVPSRRG